MFGNGAGMINVHYGGTIRCTRLSGRSYTDTVDGSGRAMLDVQRLVMLDMQIKSFKSIVITCIHNAR